MSFAIPVTTNPGLCHDQITPNDMHSSQSCAWTGSFVVLGGLGCVIWVFLRSLWLHIRIFWDKDPGHRFKWGSIVFGTILPFIFLAAILVVTGFSYRMGQTCLPNHEHAIATFWIWLVVFSILAFLLQFITTFYCFYVFMRTVWRERRASAGNSFQQRRTHQKVETWANVRNLFLLQWRNILVNVFVIIGSISFFIVFWTQDGKLGQISNDPKNIKAVKLWIICQTLSKGDKNECRKYVKDFTVNQTAVLTSLILASVSFP
jgi:amino acid transporter